MQPVLVRPRLRGMRLLWRLRYELWRQLRNDLSLAEGEGGAEIMNEAALHLPPAQVTVRW